MPDHVFEWLDGLSKESRRGEFSCLGFAGALLLVGIPLAVVSLLSLLSHHEVDKIFGTVGGITSILSALPGSKYFAARSNTICYDFLKASWQDAKAANNVSDLTKLRIEIDELRRALGKPFWSLK